MAKNKLTDLRDHLFLVMDKLQNNSDPEASASEKIDVETAKTIAEVAQVIVNSAKVEVDLLNRIGGNTSMFFEQKQIDKTK